MTAKPKATGMTPPDDTVTLQPATTYLATYVIGSLVGRRSDGFAQVTLTLSQRIPRAGGGHEDNVLEQIKVPASLLPALASVVEDVRAELAHDEARREADPATRAADRLGLTRE